MNQWNQLRQYKSYVEGHIIIQEKTYMYTHTLQLSMHYITLILP